MADKPENANIIVIPNPHPLAKSATVVLQSDFFELPEAERQVVLNEMSQFISQRISRNLEYFQRVCHDRQAHIDEMSQAAQ